MFDLNQYILTQIEWSAAVFGEGEHTEGLLKHIEKELNEVRDSPTDIMEWIDIIILALDGAWRAGFSPEDIVDALIEKQVINAHRKWPTTSNPDEPIEHIQ